MAMELNFSRATKSIRRYVINFKNMEKVVRFGISINPKLLERFDAIIHEKGYTNRSEAIRDLIRDFLVAEEWRASDEETVGALTLVYDHEIRGISDKLTDLQHKYHKNIISTLHVHLDEHNCMEVLILRGKAKEIKKIADMLISARGVKHGKLVTSTTGKHLV